MRTCIPPDPRVVHAGRGNVRLPFRHRLQRRRMAARGRLHTCQAVMRAHLSPRRRCTASSPTKRARPEARVGFRRARGGTRRSSPSPREHEGRRRAGSFAIGPSSSSISRYRGSSTIGCSSGIENGWEPAAATTRPSASQRAATRRRSRTSSSRASKPSRRRVCWSPRGRRRAPSSAPPGRAAARPRRKPECLRVEQHQLLLDSERQPAVRNYFPRTACTGRPAASQA